MDRVGDVLVSLLYAYRLRVALPPGSDESEWEPENWADFCGDHGWERFEEETGAVTVPVFSWTALTRRKHFFSARAATRRAEMLRGFGAVVMVERSEPVVWS